MKYDDTYSIELLCKEICLQKEVRAEVLAHYAEIEWGKHEKQIADLMTVDKAFDSFMELIKALPEDDRHMKLLTFYLECARRCLEKYIEKGIDKKIYLDTMSCFTRFLGEGYIKYGYYKFDCPWWAYRQLNMSIFRLGLLEFEYENTDKGKSIGIHIPANVVFNMDNVLESIKQSREFTKKHYPEYVGVDYTCHSWFLSPKLTPLLKEGSNILNFQRLFTVTEIFENENQYIGFIFNASPDTPIDQLKEDTSLQRGVKELLKQGTNLGAALGVLITK